METPFTADLIQLLTSLRSILLPLWKSPNASFPEQARGERGPLPPLGLPRHEQRARLVLQPGHADQAAEQGAPLPGSTAVRGEKDLEGGIRKGGGYSVEMAVVEPYLQNYHTRTFEKEMCLPLPRILGSSWLRLQFAHISYLSTDTQYFFLKKMLHSGSSASPVALFLPSSSQPASKAATLTRLIGDSRLRPRSSRWPQRCVRVRWRRQ